MLLPTTTMQVGGCSGDVCMCSANEFCIVCCVGIKLITAAGRRNGPECIDSKIHHNNLINNSKTLIISSNVSLIMIVVLPKIQANNSGAADALMLDPEGMLQLTVLRWNIAD